MPQGSSATISKNISSTGTGKNYQWKTILFNCNCHSFQQVATQLTKAIHCTYDKGMDYAKTVHTKGKATVCESHFEKCEAVAMVLQEIGLKVSLIQ